MHVISHQTSPTSQLTANRDAQSGTQTTAPDDPSTTYPTPTTSPASTFRRNNTHTSNEQPSTHKTQAPARPTQKETPGRPDRSTARSGHRTAKRVQQKQKTYSKSKHG